MPTLDSFHIQIEQVLVQFKQKQDRKFEEMQKCIDKMGEEVALDINKLEKTIKDS